MKDDLHVIPNNDLREHVSRPDCWCKPVEHEETSGLWVHNSLDRREEYEEGRRKH